MIVDKQLQIVMSTHSPTLVAPLPTRSVKVLEDGPDGRSRVVSVTHPQVAFNRLGHVGGKLFVAVEDALLNSLVEIARDRLDPGERDAISLYVPPGGAASILAYNIPAWISEGRNAFVILDGDQMPPGGVPNPDSLSKHELSKGAELINGMFNVRPMHVSGSTPDSVAKYLKWVRDRVFYLDAVCPEYVFLKSLAPAKAVPTMTNQEAKQLLIEELNTRRMPTEGHALSVGARWQISPTDSHVLHLRGILKKALELAQIG